MTEFHAFLVLLSIEFAAHNQRQTTPYNNITCECQSKRAKRKGLLSCSEVRFQASAESKDFSRKKGNGE